MKLSNGKDVVVYGDGTVYASGATAATELTAVELISCNVQTDKEGRQYYQKGGQKRVYLDEAVITDRDNVTVKEFLDPKNQKEYEVTITYKVNVTAPDEVSARCIAMKDIARYDTDDITVSNIKEARISDIAQKAFDLGAGGRFVVDDFGKSKDLQLTIVKDWKYDSKTDEYNLVDIATRRKMPDSHYNIVDDAISIYTGDDEIDHELERIWDNRDLKTL